ncbi:MAG: hypothetical protein BWK79_08080 [Beggiatoa sp. IS2]|nr:MAG: hypothetical protein BWK79_08080 [Beggiatoa sp. IS2]
MFDKSCLLIVDDEERGRDALEMLLAPEGYRLAFATNGEEALQQAAELIPDLILLDVMMPGMDGFEVCARLRTHPRLAEVPIMMLTALDDRESRLRGIEMGADDFISKPFDRVELRSRVRTITRLNRYRRLQVERSRFEWVVEQSEDGYILLADGDQISYANSCARLYLGLFRESSLPASFVSLINQYYKREPEVAWVDWPTPNLSGMPRYLVRPDMSHEPPLWLQVDIFELPSSTTSGQLVHLRNVTEQINLRRQMWTFQTLVSHKLRAPLNGLVSLQILNTKNMDLTSERAQDLLKIARESAKRLQDQILDILKYVDASQLLQEPTRIFCLAKLPELVTHIQEDLEITVVNLTIADVIRGHSLAFANQGLELVLRELFTNAKKFHPQRTPTLQVNVELVGDRTIKLCVIDDGRHLSHQELEKVWIPYYQSEKSFTGEVRGMGLGLAMIARLIWSSSGDCHLRNRTDGPGIVVELTLPLVQDLS